MGDRLSALDATFLEVEQMDEGATMHIGGVMVFDPPPGGGPPAMADLCSDMGSRLTSLPRYSQRLSAERTGGLAWPRWEDDPHFDIRNHVGRAALPSPGGDAELTDWSADFFSHRLDRTRPLWEMVLVDGLAERRWALATKTHHCLVDGVGSVNVTDVLLDAEPKPKRRGGAVTPAPQPQAGGGLTAHVPDAIAELARTGARAASGGAHMALHPRETLERSRALAELIVRDEVISAPHTSLNEPIGSTRRFEIVRASLPELKAVGHDLGATFNDVVLSACTTGLRNLLLSRGEEPPAAGLRAMVPMNVREASEQLALGNRVSSLFVELPVAEPGPRERLDTIIERTRKLKSGRAALGADTMLDVTSLAPPVLHAALASSMYATRLFNVTITNVPGSSTPLYAYGSQLREVHPLVPLAAGHAVGIAIVTYDESVVLGLNADRDSTPDLRVLKEGIEDGFAELRGFARPHAPARARSVKA
jgi:diacylglycerol O-acyltransferase / wax synthase